MIMPIGNSARISNMSLLCALLVVAIHAPQFREVGTIGWWWSQLFQTGICQIAVPYFFAVSGYFLAAHYEEAGWWKKEFKKRVRSLYVPYCIWNLILVVICSLFVWDGLTIKHLMAKLLSCFGIGPWSPPIGALWYVRSLLVIVLFSPLLRLLTNKIGLLLLFGVYAVTYPYVPSGIGDGPTWFSHFVMKPISTMGMFWFVLGSYLYKTKYGVFSMNRARALYLMFLGGGGAQFLRCIVIVNDLHWCFAAILGLVSIPLLMAGVWNIVGMIRVKIRFSEEAFPIYILHAFGIIVAKMILQDYYQESFLVSYVIIFFVTCSLVLLLRKMPSGMSRVLLGGR